MPDFADVFFASLEEQIFRGPYGATLRGSSPCAFIIIIFSHLFGNINDILKTVRSLFSKLGFGGICVFLLVSFILQAVLI